MNAVTVYTSPYCPYCHRALALLREKGADVHEVDVFMDAAARQEMETKSGRRTVPQIFVGDEHIGGCDDLCALEARGGLDRLLSP